MATPRPKPAEVPATDDNLFLLFSQTKVLTSSAVWTLVEEGKLSFMDKIADHLPEFAARGKADITLHQVMTHQGGFPSRQRDQGDAGPTMPGCAPRSATSRSTGRPARGCNTTPRAAHLVQAMVIEAVTGQDYRDVIRDKVLAPLGLGQRHLRRRAAAAAGALRRHLCAGAARQLGRVPGRRAAERRRLRDGARHGGVLSDAARQGAARQCAAVLAAARSPMSRATTPASAATTQMAGIPMHRGLGPHVRGESDRIRGLGTIGAPADLRAWRRRVRRIPGPTRRAACRSPISPTSCQPDPWHSARLDRVANLVHAAID